jgi:predicted metal-binding protein
MKYSVEEYDNVISTREYRERFLDSVSCATACENCLAYKNNWACPPFEDDAPRLWNRYENFQILLSRIELDGSEIDLLDDFEYSRAVSKTLDKVKTEMLNKLMIKEETTGGLVLSAGRCTVCGPVCARSKGENCVHPNRMRHSIESIGGDLVKTASELFNIKLDWAKNGHRPVQFVQILGLLFDPAPSSNVPSH